jgi:hypothetical protein
MDWAAVCRRLYLPIKQSLHAISGGGGGVLIFDDYFEFTGRNTCLRSRYVEDESCHESFLK